MSEPEADLTFRRILVALDASAQSLAALDAAIVLAAIVGADVEGLFVEDINLMRVAMLPAARHILYPSGAEEPLDSLSMERELKTLARQAQSSLALLAERSGIQWSFRVVRGKVTVEILAAASGSDLLAVGRSGWSLARKMGLGSTAENAAVHAPKALLLVKQPLAINRPVLVLFDGSPPAEQALKAAARLAEAFDGRLTVLLLPDSRANAKELRREAVQLLRTKELRTILRPVYAAGILPLSGAIASEAAGLVVLARHYLCLSEEQLQQLVRHVGNPVLLVR